MSSSTCSCRCHTNAATRDELYALRRHADDRMIELDKRLLNSIMGIWIGGMVVVTLLLWFLDFALDARIASAIGE